MFASARADLAAFRCGVPRRTKTDEKLGDPAHANVQAFDGVPVLPVHLDGRASADGSRVAGARVGGGRVHGGVRAAQKAPRYNMQQLAICVPRLSCLHPLSARSKRAAEAHSSNRDQPSLGSVGRRVSTGAFRLFSRVLARHKHVLDGV